MMATEEEIEAEAFADEALKHDAKKQEIKEVGAENGGSSFSSSSGDDESKESDGYVIPDINEDVNQRSQEMIGPSSAIGPAALPPVSKQTLQQEETSSPIGNFIPVKELFPQSVQPFDHQEPSIAFNDQNLILSPTFHTENFPFQGIEGSITGNLKNFFDASDDYQIPISNLPANFRLASSSKLQVPQTTQGNWMGASGSSNWINRNPFSQFSINDDDPALPLRSQELGFLPLLNQAIMASNNCLNDDPLTQFQQAANTPVFQQGVGPTTSSVSNPFEFNLIPKKRRTWQDHNTPSTSDFSLPFNWLSPGYGNPFPNSNFLTAGASSSSSSPRPRFLENSLYSPRYAAIGLPVDPHLRMLYLARRRESENKDGNKLQRGGHGSKTRDRKT